VVIVTLTTQTEYVSSGRLLIKRGEQTSALESDRRVYSDWEQELSSELELVRSEPILQRTRLLLRKEAAPGTKPLSLDATRVDVEVMGKSNVIGVAYSDRDPEVAHTVCDALIRTYLDSRQTLLGLADPRRFFETEIASVSEELTRKTEMRRAYSDQAGVVDLNQQRASQLSLLAGLEQQRTMLSADLAEARANSAVMRTLEKQPGVDIPMTGGSTGPDYLYELKRRVIEQEARVTQLRERYREEAPELVNANESLQSLRELLRREVAARMQVADSRIQVLEKRMVPLTRDIDQIKASLATMPDKQARLEELDRDIATLKLRYQDLVSKSDLTRIIENTRSRVSVLVLDPAGPAKQANRRDYVRLALAPAFSLVVGVGIAFFIDGLDITMHTSGQTEEAIELPVLATLPERRRSTRTHTARRPHSA
jgi:succinoglycan biosynthesis transport protein ExoP